MRRENPTPPFEQDPSKGIHIERRAEAVVGQMQKTFMRDESPFRKMGKRDFFTVFMEHQVTTKDPELLENPSLQEDIDTIYAKKMAQIRKEAGLHTLPDEDFYLAARPLQFAAQECITTYFESEGNINEKNKKYMRQNYLVAAAIFDRRIRRYNDKKNLSMFYENTENKDQADGFTPTPENIRAFAKKADGLLGYKPIPNLGGKSFIEGMQDQGHVVDKTISAYETPLSLTVNDEPDQEVSYFPITTLPTNDYKIDTPTGLISSTEPVSIIGYIWIQGPNNKLNIFGLLEPGSPHDDPRYISLYNREKTNNIKIPFAEQT